MPRSGPGRVTGLPSSRICPAVGVSRPATRRSSVDLPQPDGPRMVTKSLSPTVMLRRLQRARRLPAAHGRENARDILDEELAHARLHGNSFRFAALNRKSDTSPITPITMMPKIICPVASSAWLSMIMWPMPEDEPISSATIT